MRLVPATTFLAQLVDEEDWVLEPFLVVGSYLLLYGRQGSGKSTLAWQLAHSLTTGAPWLGHPVSRQTNVAYLNLDMPMREFRRLMLRAQHDGVPTNPRIYVPDVENVDEPLNILNNKHLAALDETLKPLQPVSIFVDTVADAFHPGTQTDVNAEAREVVGRFRRLAEGGITTFLLHERKQSPYRKAEEREDDPDAFSGATAWEAKASSSLRLTNFRNDPWLHACKTRIDVPDFSKLHLTRTDHGLFTASHSHQQMLRFWPTCVPVAERFTPATQLQVFEDVARRAGESVETVKKAFQRARKAGVEFGWLEKVGARGQV